MVCKRRRIPAECIRVAGQDFAFDFQFMQIIQADQRPEQPFAKKARPACHKDTGAFQSPKVILAENGKPAALFYQK